MAVFQVLGRRVKMELRQIIRVSVQRYRSCTRGNDCPGGGCIHIRRAIIDHAERGIRAQVELQRRQRLELRILRSDVYRALLLHRGQIFRQSTRVCRRQRGQEKGGAERCKRQQSKQ